MEKLIKIKRDISGKNELKLRALRAQAEKLISEKSKDVGDYALQRWC